MNRMNGRTLFGAALAIVIAVLSVQSVAASPKLPKSKTKDAIEGWCNENGGEFRVLESGAYTCTFPDGSWVYCRDSSCTEHPAPLTRPHGRFSEVASDGQILASQANITSQLNALSSQIESILTGQHLLIKEVNGLQAACTLADLLPIPVGAPGFSRCVSDPAGGQPTTLKVLVENQGGGNADASVTQVFFRTDAAGHATEVDVPTPPLAGFGGGIDLSVPIPASCFNTGDFTCLFKIAVNGTFVVTESNYGNNTAAGQCVGLIP
jgi:hypothetical protein